MAFHLKVKTASFGRRGVRYAITDGLGTIAIGFEPNERKAKETGRKLAKELARTVQNMAM